MTQSSDRSAMMMLVFVCLSCGFVFGLIFSGSYLPTPTRTVTKTSTETTTPTSSISSGACGMIDCALGGGGCGPLCQDISSTSSSSVFQTQTTVSGEYFCTYKVGWEIEEAAGISNNWVQNSTGFYVIGTVPGYSWQTHLVNNIQNYSQVDFQNNVIVYNATLPVKVTPTDITGGYCYNAPPYHLTFVWIRVING